MKIILSTYIAHFMAKETKSKEVKGPILKPVHVRYPLLL